MNHNLYIFILSFAFLCAFKMDVLITIGMYAFVIWFVIFGLIRMLKEIGILCE